MTAFAVACLALACAWRAMLVLSDDRRIRRPAVYRPGLDWTGAHELAPRRRWAWAGLTAALCLVPAMAAPAPWAQAVVILAAGTLIAWILRDRILHPARYTSVCIAVLALAVALAQTSPPAAGTAASFFAAQLYIVAGLRKLRSPQFMSGRVILHNFAYGTFQSLGGNHEFIPIPRPAEVLSSRTFPAACRTAALLTALVEPALGLGATGLMPPPLLIGLAIPVHLGFLLISPYRIVPFTAAALGLLTLSTLHPLIPLGLPS
ncbi:hypothetical protein [Actinomadura macrotermitis]|uniref:HTTM domain-containing protein n=1 Tax=Actinomadura macrotermitis TaxID=2585200 RepID=A0A7K0BT63_9ACTN|nr:hypothetical protein [Actinomadura macrotermitis]MQY04337.1 hypothetical protein [Actinomadura macrotermitis]